ncbi:MAG: DUF1559 domain-containing protein [Gemmataceae bacterium]
MIVRTTQQGPRAAFTLIELLVVIAIIGVLIGLLLTAVQRTRASAQRLRCQNHLKQLGLALHGYHNALKSLPPGMVSSGTNVSSARATGFTMILPYLEQDNTFRLYRFDKTWWDAENAQAVATPVPLFFCPANRLTGIMDLSSEATQWSTTMNTQAASSDYAFCRGANGALQSDWSLIPLGTRGMFPIRPQGEPGLRFEDVTDGLSTTIAMGDATGGSDRYQIRDLGNPGQPANHVLTGQPVKIEQSWSAAGVGPLGHPWYGSVLAVTAQYGLAPDPRDEPMNRRPATPSYIGGDPDGDNASGLDSLSGFRSLHAGGCNFLFGDGSVRFLSESIAPAAYRALSTVAGGEIAQE